MINMADWKIRESVKNKKPRASSPLSLHAQKSVGEETEVAVVEKSMDPRLIFCDGLMTTILGKLDVRSIAMARGVNSEWLKVASNEKLWESKCVELWEGKVHIPRMSKVPGISKMKALLLSIKDGNRNRITFSDLCDHAWEFHFSETAPAYWRNLDPYWGGSGAPMRRYFQPSGIITAGPDDRIWGNSGGSSYSIFTSMLDDGTMTQHHVKKVDNWAQLTVSRKADWGWVLANHLYCYTSIPDSADKVNGTGPLYPPRYLPPF